MIETTETTKTTENNLNLTTTGNIKFSINNIASITEEQIDDFTKYISEQNI